jgi:hypothetical protein
MIMTVHKCPKGSCFSVTGPPSCVHRLASDEPVLRLRLDESDPSDRLEIARQHGAVRLRALQDSVDRRLMGEERYVRELAKLQEIRAKRLDALDRTARSHGAGLVPSMPWWR